MSDSPQTFYQTKALEDQLTSLKFIEADGIPKLSWKNESKFRAAMKPLLVEGEIMKKVSGSRGWCSFQCTGLNEDMEYQLVEESRFQLSQCKHFSMHI